ncbi:DUF6194 family protein [Streptomyces sp. NBC_00285]|uniref:DUF6194 family protein n=1 Tax=Streptomyces sp. NBC_00285 TaxID=2975700 RepID=UPI002E2C76DD|nr:DUF6194 family protein [Streptomyces sp. NBC_00285]
MEQEHGLAAADVVLPHPVHGTLGWICVVNPGERTAGTVMRLLRTAHEAAHAQALVNRRRVSGGPQPDKGGFVDTDRRCMMADRRPSRGPPLSRRYGVPSCPARRPSSAAPVRASPKAW